MPKLHLYRQVNTRSLKSVIFAFVKLRVDAWLFSLCVSGNLLPMITVKRLMKSTTVENYISDMVFNVRHNVYKPQQLVWESCRDMSRWKSRVMKPTVLLDLGRMKPTDYSDEVTWFSNWNNEAHDDVIKWEHFPRYWPFLGEFTAHWWLPRTKASDA